MWMDEIPEKTEAGEGRRVSKHNAAREKRANQKRRKKKERRK